MAVGELTLVEEGALVEVEVSVKVSLVDVGSEAVEPGIEDGCSSVVLEAASGLVGAGVGVGVGVTVKSDRRDDIELDDNPAEPPVPLPPTTSTTPEEDEVGEEDEGRCD